ncbi:hypothetical protein GBN26_15690 [Plesiomonas shigelloides]|uniref:hypothetical protein n=1 Tax=Plesiomonas shigelloides TaxID=703 RepID=UPI00126204D4|nr:hypothetical protein [Plesiomonas shigelloides]KAB7695346.1 hypothetical protein GBN26_15690 [Plesiomonas shigelloides]
MIDEKNSVIHTHIAPWNMAAAAKVKRLDTVVNNLFTGCDTYEWIVFNVAWIVQGTEVDRRLNNAWIVANKGWIVN